MKTLLISVFTIGLSLTSLAGENVKAKIEANRQAGFLPLAVKFTCPEGTPDVSYLWDFGNGSTSPERIPTGLFVKPGTYTVKLIVRNRTETDSTTMTIDVYPNNDLIDNMRKLSASSE